MTTVDQQFDEALAALDFNKARNLLDEGVSREALESAISRVAGSGDVELVRHVLEGGADANRRSRPRPLEIAARSRSYEVVELLVDHGADPNAGSMFSSPLTTAIYADCDAIAALLVRRGAETVFSRQPVLLLAAYLGLEETVTAILEAGNDVDQRGEIQESKVWFERSRNASETERAQLEAEEPPQGTWDNATALVLAAAAGHQVIAEHLIDAGADVAAYDDAGRTAFVAARDAGHLDLAEWLTQQGAGEAELEPEEGVFEAAEAGELKSVLGFLEAGIDLEIRDSRRRGEGRTLLMSAILAGQPEIAAALLDRGADVAARDREKKAVLIMAGARADTLHDEDFRRGMTALHYAAVLGDAATIERLLATGCDPDVLDWTRSTALMLAASNDHVDVIRLLIEAGANLDLRGAESATALHVATEDDRTAAALALIEAGADTNIRDEEGNTPLLAAIYGDNDAMILALLEAHSDPKLLGEGGALALEDADLEASTLTALEKAGIQMTVLDDDDDEDDDDSELPMDRELRDLYDPELVLPRLQAGFDNEDFVAVVRDVAERCGSEARDHRDEIGGFRIHVQQRRGKGLDVEKLQDEVSERGAFVFADEVDLRQGFAQRLVVLPTTDPYDAVIAMGTNGANCCVEWEHILTWLDRARAETPWVLKHIKYDTLSGRFLTRPFDPEAMARSMDRLCPGLLEQGFGDLEALADALRESDRFHFRWD